MSLKDDVKFVKEELSSDEKLLESAFRLERVYRKHRSKIFVVLALLIAGIGGRVLYGAYHQYRLEQANEALLVLRKNPADTAAMKRLEKNNPRLYHLYNYSLSINRKDASSLPRPGKGEEILEDIVRYHRNVLVGKAGDSRYYHDLSLVEKAYMLLKKGEKEKARAQLVLVPENSPVAGIARLLKHSTLK